MDIEPIENKRGSVNATIVNNKNAVAIVTSNIMKSPAPASLRPAAKFVAGKTKATTTTVTKITKLVLKPRAEQKSRFTLTTTQHFSRQTAMSTTKSAAPDMDKTYRIRNINATTRVACGASTATGRITIRNGIDGKPKIEAKENKTIAASKREMVTQTVNNGILEEITAAVVNTGPTKHTSARHSTAFEIRNTPKKQNKPPMLIDATKSAEKSKRKSYDPVKARQFIREQQEKRKLCALERSKASVNQEEIKKRLANLRTNSLKIVNKNVKRVRNSAPASDIRKICEKVDDRRKSDTIELKVSGSVERRPSNASTISNMSKQSQRERIGILRRPDGLDDPVAPKPAPPLTSLTRSNNTKSKLSSQPIVGESAAPKPAQETEHKMDLQMPSSMSLKSSLLMENASTPNNEGANELRYWLRPTPVQPYPYNFIMAVRKKLELVTHPVLKSTRSAAESQLTSIVNNFAEPNKLTLTNGTLPQDHHLKSQESLNSETVARVADSYSEEYSTNFSSVTLKSLDRSQMRVNDILSSTKMRPPRLDAVNDDSQDTLSISSGILSHSSPEKKRKMKNQIAREPTPLSTNHADSLHIVSRSISQPLAGGDHSEPLDVQKMLSEFNENLSQVIKVNRQLHTVLSNPPSARPVSITEQMPTSTEEYSDDVDNFASDRPSTGKMTIEEKTTSTPTLTTTATPSERIASDAESIMDSELERRQSSSTIKESGKESDGIKSLIAEQGPTTASMHESDEMQTQIDESQSHSQSIRSFQKRIIDEREMMNTSIGSDIFTILKQTAAVDLNSSTWSDGNVSYSNLGMCEQLIQTETQKTEHLATLLKLREKSLIDRFKGQIVWLELQKQKLKAKGMTVEISAVKKRQRALLIRLDKDRKELHRLMKSHQKPPASTELGPNVNYKISHLCTNMNIRRTSMTTTNQYADGATPMQAMKAIELPGNSNLEMMLQKRENELRMRREHVEKLLDWHQRLDVEEQEIMKMEQMVMMLTTAPAASNDTFNNAKSHDEHVHGDNLAITVHRKAITAKQQQLQQQQQQQQQFDSQRETISSSNNTSLQLNEKREKHIRKIEKSLQMLHNISVRSASSDNGAVDSNIDYEQHVEVSGRQLNRLWKRLTGQFEEKFTAQRVYTLTKDDLEGLYEEAKLFVLKKFHSIEINRLINQSVNNSSSVLGEFDQTAVINDSNAIAISEEDNVGADEMVVAVPALELHHSSSTDDISSKHSAHKDLDHGYYFSSESTGENNIASNVPETATNKTSIVDDDIDEEIKESTEDQNSVGDDGITPITYHDSEDMHSDITEDSLNRTKVASQESEATIESVVETATQIDESMVEVASSTTPANETQMIEDISFPHINVTMTLHKSESIDDENKYSSDDLTKSEKPEDSNEITTEISNEEQQRSPQSTSPLSPTIKSKELEQRLIDLDDSLKDLNETISRSPVLGMRSDSASPDIDPPSEEIQSILNSTEQDEASENIQQKLESSESSSSPPSTSTNAAAAVAASAAVPIKLIEAKIHPEIGESLQTTTTTSMPKYTNSFVIEALRRTPVSVEKSTLDQSASISFPFLREIPNKPPPPYPTHRHPPKTTLPSDERINEIVYQNIERLHAEWQQCPIDDKTFTKSPNQITTSPMPAAANEASAMFERIIVDVCDEIMDEFKIDQKYPLGKPIAFYNPPDRLKCLQEHAWRRIKQLFGCPNVDGGIRTKGNSSNGVQQMNARCLPSQMANMTCNNRRKRDMVDEILIQELYEDEPKWTNFDLEELEVRNNVKDLTSLLTDEPPSIDENQTEDAEVDSSSTNESKSTPTDQ